MEKPTLIEIHFEKFTGELPHTLYDTLVWVTDDDFSLLADGNDDQIKSSLKRVIEDEEYELDTEAETFSTHILKSVRCNKSFDDEDRISLTSLICVKNDPDVIEDYLYYEPCNPFGEGTKVYVKWMVGDNFVDYYILEEDGELNTTQDWSEEDDKIFDDFDTILNNDIESMLKDEETREWWDLDDQTNEYIDKYFRKGMMIE